MNNEIKDSIRKIARDSKWRPTRGDTVLVDVVGGDRDEVGTVLVGGDLARGCNLCGGHHLHPDVRWNGDGKVTYSVPECGLTPTIDCLYSYLTGKADQADLAGAAETVERLRRTAGDLIGLVVASWRINGEPGWTYNAPNGASWGLLRNTQNAAYGGALWGAYCMYRDVVAGQTGDTPDGVLRWLVARMDNVMAPASAIQAAQMLKMALSSTDIS